MSPPHTGDDNQMRIGGSTTSRQQPNDDDGTHTRIWNQWRSLKDISMLLPVTVNGEGEGSLLQKRLDHPRGSFKLIIN